MLKLGKGYGRQEVRRALARGMPLTVVYENILDAEDIREAVAGIRDAGNPHGAQLVLAWLASHPNSPEDVLRDLQEHGDRAVLMSLAFNRNLPADLKEALLDHEDDRVREFARHVFSHRVP